MKLRLIVLTGLTLSLLGCREISPVHVLAPTLGARPIAEALDTRELPELREVSGFVRGQHLVVEATLELHDWTAAELEAPGGWHVSGYFANRYGVGITHFWGHADGHWRVVTAAGEVTGVVHVQATSRRFRLQVPLRALADEDGVVYWGLEIWQFPVAGYGGGSRSYGGLAQR